MSDLHFVTDPVADLVTATRVELGGAVSINGAEDVACTTLELETDRVSLLVDATADCGAEVIVSLPNLGLQKGSISRLFLGGFEVQFERPGQGRLGTYLDCLNGGPEPISDERRAFARIVPLKKLVTLERTGEAPSMARIVDVSRTGIAFTTSKHLTEGERVWIGQHAGRVTRLFEGGAAIHFEQLLGEAHFEAMCDATVDEPSPLVTA